MSKVIHGTTNVFADLGFEDAAERQTKTRLAMQIVELAKARGGKQAEVAKTLGIPQPKVSALLNYRLDGFSVERLMALLTALDQDVEIFVRPSREHGKGRVTVHAVD